MKITKQLMTMVMVLGLSVTSWSYAFEREAYYVDDWCSGRGIQEHVLPDRTRIDCLTEEYAIEFDFGYKWAESIGQSLYYAKMTNLKPAVVLIITRDQERFIERFSIASEGLGITLIVYYVD